MRSPPRGRRSSSARQEKLWRPSSLWAVLLCVILAACGAAVAPTKVCMCRGSWPRSRVRVRFSRGATAGTLHSMVKALPTVTQVGCSFSSTCSGGSAGGKVGRLGAQSQQAHPAKSTPYQHYVLKAPGWTCGPACKRGRRKQLRVKGVLGGSVRNVMVSAVDKNGGG